MQLPRWMACLAALSGLAWAQRSPLPPDRLEKVRGVLDAVYRLEYKTAEERSREMMAQWPEDPAGYVYLARVFWQELLFAERALTLQRYSQPDFFSERPRYKAAMDPAAERRFRAASGEAIRRAREFAQRRPRDPAALYLLGAAYQNEASFQISLNNAWLTAVQAGNPAHRAHRRLLGLDASYGDARLVTGIYSYSAASIPWSIRWIALLLGYQGSKEKGREDLEAAASRGTIVAADAATVLVLVYCLEKRFELAIRKLEEMRRWYPENYLVDLDLAGLRLRLGEPAAAVALYQEALHRMDAGGGRRARIEKSIVCNYLGVAYRKMADLAQAEKWFRLALEGESSSARLELGKTLDLAGRRGEAIEQYQLVRQAPDQGNSHREAARCLSRPCREK
ncbi:MAG: hypothetical protein HY822_21255 [Acidobacteria bacterium]|nr:hypothetical protein [Acidobacteriota bacterium]